MHQRTLGTRSVHTCQFYWFHPCQRWWAESTASVLAPVCSPSSGCAPAWAPADAAETRRRCSACTVSPSSHLLWRLPPEACSSPAGQKSWPRSAGSQTWGWSGREWRSCHWPRWPKVSVTFLFLVLKCWWWTGPSADCLILGGKYNSSVSSGSHWNQDFAVKDMNISTYAVQW